MMAWYSHTFFHMYKVFTQASDSRSSSSHIRECFYQQGPLRTGILVNLDFWIVHNYAHHVWQQTKI